MNENHLIHAYLITAKKSFVNGLKNIVGLEIKKGGMMATLEGTVKKISLDKSKARIEIETNLLQDTIDFVMLLGKMVRVNVEDIQEELFKKVNVKSKGGEA